MPNRKTMSEAEIDQIISSWTPKTHGDAYNRLSPEKRSQLLRITSQKLGILNIHASKTTTDVNWKASNGSQADDGLFLLAASPKTPGHSSSALGVAIDERTKKATTIVVNAWVGSDEHSDGSLNILGSQLEGKMDVQVTKPLDLLKHKLINCFTITEELKSLNLDKRKIIIDVKSNAYLSRSDSLTLTTLMTIIQAAMGCDGRDDCVFSADVSVDGKISAVGGMSQKSEYVTQSLNKQFFISQANANDIPENIGDEQIFTFRFLCEILTYLNLSIPQTSVKPNVQSKKTTFHETRKSQGKGSKEPAVIERLINGERNFIIERGFQTESYEIISIVNDTQIYNGIAICKARRMAKDCPDEIIVLKIMTIDNDNANQEDVNRDAFMHDAFIMSKDIHPNVLKAKGVPFSLNKEFFVPMEYGEGTLDQFLDHILLEIRVQWAFHLIEALSKIHKAGYIHGDIKPPNVLIVDQEPKLADFGVSSYGTPEFRHPGLIDAANKELLFKNISMKDRKQWDNYAMGMMIFWMFCPNHCIEGVKDIPLADGQTETVGLSTFDMDVLKTALADSENKDRIVSIINDAVKLEGGEPMDLSKKLPGEKVKEIFKNGWGPYVDCIKNMVTQHPITVSVLTLLCIVAGIYFCAIIPETLYDRLFVEFHYLAFATIFFGVYPLLTRKVFREQIENILHTTILILFVGFFIGAYVTPWLYGDSSSAPCAAKRIFRMQLSDTCCESLEARCQELKTKKQWDSIIELVHGFGPFRAGIQPEDACYMRFFEHVALARYALMLKETSQSDIASAIKAIQQEYHYLLASNLVIFNQINQIPLTQSIVRPKPYPINVLKKAKQWSVATIQGKEYEILKPEMIQKITEAIKKWNHLEKRRKEVWKINN